MRSLLLDAPDCNLRRTRTKYQAGMNLLHAEKNVNLGRPLQDFNTVGSGGHSRLRRHVFSIPAGSLSIPESIKNTRLQSTLRSLGMIA